MRAAYRHSLRTSWASRIFCYFRAHPDKFDPASQTDQIVPLFTIQAMPVGFAGMVIAAIFASSMSTVASAMNSVATIFTEDFYLKLRPAATDRQRLVTLKTTSYVVGFIATGIAFYLATLRLDSILVVWNQISALLGGGIVGVYSLGMFTRRANGFGAVGGALVSIVLTGSVKLFTPAALGHLPADRHSILYAQRLSAEHAIQPAQGSARAYGVGRRAGGRLREPSGVGPGCRWIARAVASGSGACDWCRRALVA